MKRIKQISIVFGAGTVLGILLLLTASKGVSAAGVCPDDGDWGVTSGNSSNPGGLVVRTVHENGTNIDVSFDLSTVDTGAGDIAGYSIVRNDTNFIPVQFIQSGAFSTGGTFYCPNSDTYTGYLVLGFGSTPSNGNRWTLWCQEVTDTSGSFNWNDEEFQITNLPSTVGSETGTWTSNLAGNDPNAVFTVGNGSTKRITLTFHPNNADLRVTSVSSSPSPVSVDQVMSFSGTVNNNETGNAAASETLLRIDVGNDGTWDVTPANAATSALSGGSSETENWNNVWTAVDGTHKYEICADATGVVSETDNGNNCRSTTFTTQKPDIRITASNFPSGSGPGGSYHKDDTINFTSTINNNGPGKIMGNFVVFFCRDGWNNVAETCSGTSYTRTITCPTCNDGATWSADFTFNAPNSNGTFTWGMKADYVAGNANGAIVEGNEGNNKVSGSYDVAGVRAWFLAADGNVGSLGNITIQKPPPIGYSTTYLGIAQGAISVFNSAKGWIISGYNPINLKPAPIAGSIYDVLLTKYKPKTVANINAAIPAGGGIFKYVPGGGTLALNNTNWTKGPTMIFVEGKLRFNGDFTSNANTGMVFVANQDVEIQSNVQTVASVIFFDGSFKSGKSGVGNPDEQLRMIGGIVGGFESGSTITLERDLGINNDTLPAEEFKFEPKYLWYFKELIGELKPVFEELTP